MYTVLVRRFKCELDASSSPFSPLPFQKQEIVLKDGGMGWFGNGTVLIRITIDALHFITPLRPPLPSLHLSSRVLTLTLPSTRSSVVYFMKRAFDVPLKVMK